MKSNVLSRKGMENYGIEFWRVWVNDSGESCQSLHSLVGHKQSVFAEGAAPIWSAMHYNASAKLITLILFPGEICEWHENPMPQWIIPLRGRWSVETMDGTIVEMGPGDISFGGDQGTNNRQGHRSWAVGETPAELLLIQVKGAPPWNPCV
ncbi:cupin domain-containing protein [Synechococcus sp. MIT S9451]|uniref:cupin domain-containing protein n=1 Tax=Synechococcus sp. MIT S9451 TaxID=3082543 RepID=UPI0039B47524